MVMVAFTHDSTNKTWSEAYELLQGVADDCSGDETNQELTFKRDHRNRTHHQLGEYRHLLKQNFCRTDIYED